MGESAGTSLERPLSSSGLYSSGCAECPSTGRWYGDRRPPISSASVSASSAPSVWLVRLESRTRKSVVEAALEEAIGLGASRSNVTLRECRCLGEGGETGLYMHARSGEVEMVCLEKSWKHMCRVWSVGGLVHGQGLLLVVEYGLAKWWCRVWAMTMDPIWWMAAGSCFEWNLEPWSKAEVPFTLVDVTHK